MTYCVASTDTDTLESKAIPGEQRLRPSPKIVPKGTVHAYDPVTKEVACGEDPTLLTPFEDIPWLPARSFLERCNLCIAVAG